MVQERSSPELKDAVSIDLRRSIAGIMTMIRIKKRAMTAALRWPLKDIVEKI
jgi:hypothetical protein